MRKNKEKKLRKGLSNSYRELLIKAIMNEVGFDFLDTFALMQNVFGFFNG